MPDFALKYDVTPGVALPSTSTASDSDALFEVKDKDGNVVFAVYPNAARVYVDEEADNSKAMATIGAAIANASDGNIGISKDDITDAVVNSVAAVVGMIPEGLILLTSTVLAVSVIRLTNKRVLIEFNNLILFFSVSEKIYATYSKLY